MATLTSSGGYSYEFLDTKASSVYECPICKLVSREPQQANCCGQIYCKSCLQQLEKCPTCNSSLDDNYFFDKRTDREIKSLQVFCPNKVDGCTWKGTVKDVDDHLPMCSKNDNFLKQQLQLALKEIQVLRKRIEYLEEKNRNPSYHYVQMTGYTKMRNSDTSWYSQGFYISPGSYKMCLNVDANGFGGGKGTHTSAFIYLMQGENDDNLDWPFRGNVKLELLNQLQDKHHEENTMHFNDSVPLKYKDRVVGRERAADGWGFSQFVAHTELNYSSANNCQYLMDDMLFFRVSVKLTKPDITQEDPRS